MALQVVSPGVNVYRVTGIKDGQEQTEEHTFLRGSILPDWVSSYQQFVLTSTGMARQVGDFPDPGLRAERDMPAPVLLPEHDPRTVIGNTGVDKPMAVTRVVQEGVADGGSAGGELPKESDTKQVWEDFAVANGYHTRNKAESMRKPDLMSEVTGKHKRAVAEREHADPAALLPPAFEAPKGKDKG